MTSPQPPPDPLSAHVHTLPEACLAGAQPRKEGIICRAGGPPDAPCPAPHQRFSTSNTHNFHPNPPNRAPNPGFWGPKSPFWTPFKCTRGPRNAHFGNPSGIMASEASEAKHTSTRNGHFGYTPINQRAKRAKRASTIMTCVDHENAYIDPKWPFRIHIHQSASEAS